MKPLFSREYLPTHLMNPARRYTRNTDVAKTFARIRAELAKEEGATILPFKKGNL